MRSMSDWIETLGLNLREMSVRMTIFLNQRQKKDNGWSSNK